MLRRHVATNISITKPRLDFFSRWPVTILDLFPIMARCTDYLIVYVIHYTHSGIEGMSPDASGFRPYLLHPLFSQRPYVVTMDQLTLIGAVHFLAFISITASGHCLGHII